MSEQRFAAYHPAKEGARIIAELVAKKAGYDPTSASDESYQQVETVPGLAFAEEAWRYEATFRINREDPATQFVAHAHGCRLSSDHDGGCVTDTPHQFGPDGCEHCKEER